MMPKPEIHADIFSFFNQKVVATTGTLTVKEVETPTETRSRLEKEVADAAHRRQIELLIVRAFLAILAVTVIGCLVTILFLPNSPERITKFAETLLTSVGVAVVSGLAGYFKGISRPSS